MIQMKPQRLQTGLYLILSLFLISCQAQDALETQATEVPTKVSIESTPPSAEVTTSDGGATEADETETVREQATETPPPPPTDTPEPERNVYMNEAVGISLSYPNGWFDKEYSNLIILASTQELIDSEDNQQGAIVYLKTLNTEGQGGLDPLSFFVLVREQQRLLGKSDPFIGLERFTMPEQKQEMVSAVITSRDDFPTDGIFASEFLSLDDAFAPSVDVTAYVAVITNNEHIGIFIGATSGESADSVLPPFAEMTQSFSLSENVSSRSNNLLVERSFYNRAHENMLMFRGDSVRGPLLDLSPSPVNVVSATWSFAALEGEEVDLSIGTTKPMDLHVTVISLNQEEPVFLYNDIVPGDGLLHELNGLQVPVTDIYRIVVKSDADERGSNYLLTLSGSEGEDFVSLGSLWPALLEANEDFLFEGSPETGQFLASSPSIWSYFGSEASQIDVDVQAEQEVSFVVDVLDSEGQSILGNGPVASEDGRAFLSGITIPTTAQYFISVSGDSDIMSVYQITVN